MKQDPVPSASNHTLKQFQAEVSFRNRFSKENLDVEKKDWVNNP